MKVKFITDPHHRKGVAVLLRADGSEVERIECWSQTYQGRAMALEHFQGYLRPDAEGKRPPLLWTIEEAAR